MNRQNLHSDGCARRGIASLEFVMSLPFLLGLGAIILSIGIAGVHRTWTTTQVRHEVWKIRSSQPAETRSKPLYILAGADAGMIQGETVSTFRLYDWLGGSMSAKSKSAVLGGVWDYREITEFTDNPGTPHFLTVLRAVGVPDRYVTAATKIMSLLSFDNLPNQGDIDKAGEGVEEAEEVIKKRRAEIQAKLKALREELAELNRQRAELQTQRDAKQGEVDRLQREYNELVAQGATQQQLNAKLSQLRAAEAERDELDRQIRVKDRQIRDKEREIRSWEEEARKAENEGGAIGN